MNHKKMTKQQLHRKLQQPMNARQYNQELKKTIREIADENPQGFTEEWMAEKVFARRPDLCIRLVRQFLKTMAQNN